MHSEIKIFYAVPEYFPPWRLDVGHLFAEQLPQRGMRVTWSMWRDERGSCSSVQWRGQSVKLPLSAGRANKWARIMSRVSHLACEFPLFAGHLFRHRYDLIQARDVRYAAAFLGWLAARLTGAKFTYWLSYPFPEHYLEWSRDSHGLSRIVRWLQGTVSFWFVYKWLMHRADHVFVQSGQMARDVASYGVPMEKLTPVPMGVPPALLDWLQHNPTDVVAERVVYVGTLAKVRRLETLIQAFAQVAKQRSNAILIMVGDGDHPSERAFLEEEVRRLGISDRVSFTGFVPMEDAWRYAASAQICISPFFPTFVLRSTSPTKLNEYFALGRPVVANDHPEQSWAIGQSGAGLCVSWGADDFAEAMFQLLEHPEQAEDMAAKGPAWVKANRTYNQIADHVYEKYGAILREGR